MSRAAFLGLGLLGAGLVATLALEMETADPPETSPVARTLAPPVAVHGGGEKPQRVDGWVAIVLARPLLSPTRRPALEAAATSLAEPAQSGLPRLSGTMVSPGGRSAIFASPEGGRAVVVAEDGQIGRWTIHSIEAGQVTIDGPDGSRTLKPMFEHGAEPSKSPAPGNDRSGNDRSGNDKRPSQPLATASGTADRGSRIQRAQ
jgi:hypothetical protein